MRYTTCLVALSLALVSGCTFTSSNNRFTKRIVMEKPLAKGGVLRIGYDQPEASAGCKEVYVKSQNWSMAEFTGMTNMSGGYGKLMDEAVDYANAHPQDGINYVLLDIPSKTEIMGLNVTMMRKAHTRFYRCKNPPAKHNNPFTDAK